MAFEARVGVGTIYQWTKTYKTKGYDGLKSLKRGRTPMNKKYIRFNIINIHIMK